MEKRGGGRIRKRDGKKEGKELGAEDGARVKETEGWGWRCWWRREVSKPAPGSEALFDTDVPVRVLRSSSTP